MYTPAEINTYIYICLGYIYGRIGQVGETYIHESLPERSVEWLWKKRLPGRSIYAGKREAQSETRERNNAFSMDWEEIFGKFRKIHVFRHVRRVLCVIKETSFRIFSIVFQHNFPWRLFNSVQRLIIVIAQSSHSIFLSVRLFFCSLNIFITHLFFSHSKSVFNKSLKLI